MMWELNNFGQASSAAFAMLLGVLISLFYDLFRIDRLIFKRSVITICVQDIIFWSVTAFLLFCLFLLTTNGIIRIYILFIALIGFIICRLTLSRIALMIVQPIKKLTVKIRKKYISFIFKISKIDNHIVLYLKNQYSKIKCAKKRYKKEKNNNKNS